MTTLRAIETRYKGYRFRSRLEARWAVFFDAMGLEWEYEPQGFSLGHGVSYLPDFFVKRLGYVEIKPEGPEIMEVDRAKWRGLGRSHDLLVLFGVPTEPDWLCFNTPQPSGMFFSAAPLDSEATAAIPAEYRGLAAIVQHPYITAIGACRRCGGFGVASVESIRPWATLLCEPGCASDRWPADHERLYRAIETARGARFEHGERGA